MIETAPKTMRTVDRLPDTLSTQTLNQMMAWLREGTFKPGSKLPSQNELVEQLGVSRTGVREALQMMAAMQLIEIRQGLGCFVKRVSPDCIINPDVLSILLEKETLLQVIETRKIIESGTAALASERGKTEDFWLMEDILTRIDRQIQRNESVAQAAAEFHFAVAKATHNEVLAKLVQSFTHLMTRAGALLESEESFKRNELTSHQDLYRIIRQGDPEKARIAMLEHIAVSESKIVEVFEQASAAADQN